MEVPSKLPHVAGEPAPKAPEGKEYVLKAKYQKLGFLLLLPIFLCPIGIVCLLLAARRKCWVLVDTDTSKHHTENGSNNHESGKADPRDVELGGKCAEHQTSESPDGATSFAQRCKRQFRRTMLRIVRNIPTLVFFAVWKAFFVGFVVALVVDWTGDSNPPPLKTVLIAVGVGVGIWTMWMAALVVCCSGCCLHDASVERGPRASCIPVA
ncbi:hypothetical protein BSKO_14082 [Bryopsis sp. KO-2023]|nr:hypothetical protein BSKO_14082 [Bryopsis sp. KO-2023]